MLNSYFDLQTVVYLLVTMNLLTLVYVTLVSNREDSLAASWSSGNASCELKLRM